MPVSNAYRDELRERYHGQLARALQIPTSAVEISDGFVAYLFAKDLMAGDRAKAKAGYTAPNAFIAAVEVFPEINRPELAAKLGIRRDEARDLVREVPS